MSATPLPRSGCARESLRERGQFWTPDWVADAMVTYVLGAGARSLFCPAVGPGTFFAAARRVAGTEIALSGAELHPEVFSKPAQGLVATDFERVSRGDFLACAGLAPARSRFEAQPAIVANPPYIRHHRLSAETKAALQRFAIRLTGASIDGRAGLHVYFLLRSLSLLEHEGRLAFILPADTFEGVFADGLWQWVSRRFCVEAVVTFAPEATPFPGVDTNAVVVLISNGPPSDSLVWAECQVCGDHLTHWVGKGFPPVSGPIHSGSRQLHEALVTGLSRPPSKVHLGAVLSDFASVMRGVATGANDFFFLTRQDASALGIPGDLLLPAIGRTRDLPDHTDELTNDWLDVLDDKGRPTLLFVPDGRPLEAFPSTVQAYLRRGADLGLPERPLIGIRRPWYKMETRKTPDFLFAYLGRRSSRFIRNQARVIPLNGFHCVYARDRSPGGVDALWDVLRDPGVTAALRAVGKSYGSGAIKVEPRNLDRLPLNVPAPAPRPTPQLVLSLTD